MNNLANGNLAHSIQPINKKYQEILAFLSGSYWENDIWDKTDSTFSELRTQSKTNVRTKRIYFNSFSSSIRAEIKYMYATKLQKREINLNTIIYSSSLIKYFAAFLDQYYPNYYAFYEPLYTFFTW